MGGGILVAACFLVWQASALKTSFESRMDAMDRRQTDSQATLQTQIIGIQTSLREASQQNVEVRDMRLWVMMLRDKNKDRADGKVDIPDWVGK